MRSDSQIRTQIALEVRRIRTRLKLSQRELADEIGSTKVSVSQWERGVALPSVVSYLKIIDMEGEHENGKARSSNAA